MSSLSTRVSAVSTEAARAELQAVLTSGAFARARMLSNLLSYLCEKQLSGEAGQLKEYTIAVEAYGRTADFQQKENSIVRVEIKRLREKLRQYYEGEGVDHEVQISIPVGQYVPVFLQRAVDASVGHPACDQPIKVDMVPSEDELNAATSFPVPGNEMGAANAKELRVVGGRRWLWIGALALVTAGLLITLKVQPLFRESLSGNISANAAASNQLLAATAATTVTELDEIRILAGIEAAKYVDRAGRVWWGDRYFSGGNPLRTSKPMIFRTLNSEIYHSGRQGDFSYDIPLKPGVYELRLHFAETFYGPDEQQGGGETSRLFAVMCNDQPLLRPIDIISEADGNRTAEIKVFKDIRPAADGLLHLRFYSWTHGKAIVNGLEILPARAGAIRPIRFTTHDKPVFTRDGHEWQPDGYFKGGRTISRPGSLTGTNHLELYETERFGHFSYSIPVAPGRYTVTLHFAERFFGPANSSPAGKGPGSRIFHVFCNGEALLKNFDIFKEAGGQDRVLTRRFTGLQPNAQGKLLLEFKPVSNYPLVNAIEVVDEAWK